MNCLSLSVLAEMIASVCLTWYNKFASIKKMPVTLLHYTGR